MTTVADNMDIKEENIRVKHHDEFRDQLATMDEHGKRKWIYARQPKGRFYNIRSYLSLLYFIAFFGLPFLHINGRPLFLFNVNSARYILFGNIFWPQDFFILGLGMIAFIFFIILFTAAFGRLFCGWACPQTNFMEMMFRKVEFWIEGSDTKQKMLVNQPWNANKIVRKSAKHIAFYLLSFIIANTFLAYIIGVHELEKIVTGSFTEHIAGFASLLIFSGVFYGVYAFFREQACTVVCPYGRLQGVLLDKNSMVVAYDHKRGEPRGLSKKNEPKPFGDCIDCFACVKVCPTGIDIRNGVQMECVGCTACIDACDNIMDHLGKPRGLIRYASENSIENGEPLKYTSRMKMYTALCGVVVLILSVILITRNDVAVTIMRTPGILYQERGTDSISNLYNIKLSNKTTQTIPTTLRLEGASGAVQLIGKNHIDVVAEGQGSGSFFIVLPKKNLHQRKTELSLGLYDGSKKITIVKTNFLGPVPE